MIRIIEVVKTNRLAQIALVLVAMYVVYWYLNRDKKEGMHNEEHHEMMHEEEIEGVENVPEDPQQKQLQEVAAGKPQLTADDLLPKYDDANEFAKQNPVSKLLKEQNFLISGYHVGINTVMQSNKIPYHDLRSAPPIPKETVGPWSQSSFETPAGGAGSRKMFEIGSV